jgi:hypothetical protein
MPEALAIVAVFAVAVVIYIAMWVQSRDPAHFDPAKEAMRLEHQVSWLAHRLTKARRERWEAAMVENLAAELAAAEQRLAEMKARLSPPAAIRSRP